MWGRPLSDHGGDDVTRGQSQPLPFAASDDEVHDAPSHRQTTGLTGEKTDDLGPPPDLIQRYLDSPATRGVKHDLRRRLVLELPKTALETLDDAPVPLDLTDPATSIGTALEIADLVLARRFVSHERTVNRDTRPSASARRGAPMPSMSRVSSTPDRRSIDRRQPGVIGSFANIPMSA